MGEINIGTITNLLSEKIRESVITESKMDETKVLFQEFLDVINESKLLKLEFNVYDALTTKHIENDVIATRFIDNNIKLFETYTLQELNKEREKLNIFVSEGLGVTEKTNLYESINTLIVQSLLPSDEIDVDLLHEAFSVVLNYIKTPTDKRKTVLDEILNIDKMNEEIIELAIEKYNNKYGSLNENDRTLLTKLIKLTNKEKKQLFEQYKTETLDLLESIVDPNAQDKKTVVVNKINNMTFDEKSVNEQIIKLHELKFGLDNVVVVGN